MWYTINAARTIARKTAPCLEREERDRESQIARLATIEVPMREGDREGYPLDVREVELIQPEEARRRETVNHRRERRTGHADADGACEHVRAERAQRCGDERRDVHGEHRVAGQPQHRRREQRAADQVLRIGKRMVQRIENVGLEDRERPMDQRVDIPRERPDVQVRVGSQRHDMVARVNRQRVSVDDGERDAAERQPDHDVTLG